MPGQVQCLRKGMGFDIVAQLLGPCSSELPRPRCFSVELVCPLVARENMGNTDMEGPGQLDGKEEEVARRQVATLCNVL